MATYTTNSENVEAVQWTGTNLDAVVALVGAPAVAYVAGELRVNNELVPTGYYVVKNEDGTVREVASSGRIGTKYTPSA